jgi:nucleotide-binding universal stress UspA family protein
LKVSDHIATREQSRMADSKRIVVGVDGSAMSYRALEWALEEARLREAVCVLVHAYIEHGPAANPFGEPYKRQSEEGARQVLADAVALAEKSGAPFDAKVAAGHPAEVLLREAGGAELLVVGSHGRGAVATVVLGSVSMTCAHHAPCPITIVRHSGAPAEPSGGSG